MNSTASSPRPAGRAAFRTARLSALTLALIAWSWRASAQPVSTIPDAPTVSPAPIIEKPLPPAGGETMDRQPSPQHLWVGGHWRWQEGAYVWVTGHWEVPPRTNVVWIAPRWEAKGNGFVLVEGYWQESAAPAPAQVAQAPQPPPQQVVIVETPPPPTREIIVERPSGGHVWVGGYWAWHGGRYVWIGGHWETPPRNNVVWVEPRWERRGNGYVLIEGYWREVSYERPSREVVVVRPTPPREVIIRQGPPAPLREFVSERERPSSRHIWIGGYWAWQANRYVWIAGHWDLPPRGRGHWEEPRWEERGGTYIFIEGRWR